MTKECQSKMIKCLFSAFFIFLSMLLISCGSSNNTSSLPSGDSSNNTSSLPSGDSSSGGGGGNQTLVSCGDFTQCFVEEIDSNGDTIFDSSIVSCYAFDVNGNRLTALITYDDGNDGSIENIDNVSYDYDWNNKLLTMVCKSDTDADGSLDGTEVYTWLLDAHGNRIEGDIEIDSDADKVIDEQRKVYLTYDACNEITSWITEVDGDADDDFNGPADSRSAHTYTRTYDSDCRIIELVIAFDHDGDNWDDAYHTFRYTYDAGGNRIQCDIDYDNNADNFAETKGIAHYTQDADGYETEEGERYGGPNDSVDYAWSSYWNYTEICSSSLSKPLDPLYVLK